MLQVVWFQDKFLHRGTLTPDGHGTSGNDQSTWVSLGDGSGKGGEKQVGMFASGTEKVTLEGEWCLK